MNPGMMGILLLISLMVLMWSLYRRITPMFAMQYEKRWDRPFWRLGRVLKFGIGQARFLQRFELTHGIAHLLIFWGFLVVSINNINLIGRGFVPNWSLPGFHETDIGLAYAFLKNLFALAIIAGTLFALGRRIVKKPPRMLLSLEANLILLWICGIEVMDVIYEGSLFMMFPGHHEQSAAFLSSGFMKLLSSLGYADSSELILNLNTFGYWGHLVMALAFINYLPYCKQFHEITSFLNIFFSDTKNRGELKKLGFENEDTIFGVSKIEEFSWKRALDMHSCAECGRCHANCPAHLTDKPLSPMHLIMDEREHFNEKASMMRQSVYWKFRKNVEKAEEASDSWSGATLTGEVIKDEAIWSCTTCGHCIANCPLMIEHVDNIIDLRRDLVQVEGRTPSELTPVFKNFENMSNPWGIASNSRGDWFESLGVQTPAENTDFEYLLFVGCAGSFDKRNRKVATSVVKLLQQADVNFVCLGDDENCCGETVRRLGNEYLAQAMMEANVELWKELGVKKIITACPHCFNTLKNEYPQFGGDFTIIHHTEMLQELLGSGRLEPKAGLNGNGPVAYHDACYLGRYNEIYEAPRRIMSRMQTMVSDVVAPEREKRTSFCCGGGGGRMWMEENIGGRINKMRCDQLLETGARTFLTACPYCLIMLEDALKDQNIEDEIKIMDMAELVQSGMEKESHSLK